MYKYINILTTAIFFMSLYVIYGNYRSSKGKKYIVPMVITSLILINRFVFIYYSNETSVNLNSNCICEIIIILFIMQLNNKEKASKKNRILILINYIISIISLLIILIIGENIYTQALNVFMMMITLYLFSINLYISKNKKNYNIIIMAYFLYVSLTLVIRSSAILMLYGAFLNLVASIYIFSKIFKDSVVEIYKQKSDVTGKLRRTNITIKMHDEKLNINKKFSKTIYDNLEKKNLILDLILDQSNKCVLLIDDEGYILNEDDGFSKMWKEYKDCRYNINISTFLSKSIKNSDEFIKCMKKCSDNFEEVTGELQGRDGRFFSCTYAPFTIQNQKMGVLCVINDITYKKKSEIKIRENDVKYKKIVDNIPYSILLTNNNDILYNNEKNEYVDFYKDDLKNIILQSSTSGELHYCNDGSEVCFNIDRVSFVEGIDSRNLVVIRDITEYKKLLRDVEYNKKKYEALVNIIPEGIYISNYDNKNITYANPKFLEMLGSDNIHETDLDNIHESTIITSGNSNNIVKFKRNTVKNIYGEEVHIESGAMLIDVNHRLKLIGIVRDITDQVKTEMIEREIEERRRANKIKDEFFINMSHELKTPLNLIYSSNQLVETLYKEEISKNPTGELARATGIVRKHLYMLMALINNIMVLAKLESDFHYVKKDYYNIIDIIEDIVCDFNKCIDVNNINIVFDTDEEERIANVDPLDIEKIVLTLLSLVIRYSKNDSTINVDLNSTNDNTTIYIRNIGGYDFDRYFNDQAKRSLDIGVSVAKLIINLYNGNINIINENKEDITIVIDIAVDKDATDYRSRVKDQSDEVLYADYIRMCNF